MSKNIEILSLLTGFGIGAAIGILFAPEKGSTIRKRFKRKSYVYNGEMEIKFNELIDSITEQFENIVSEVTRLSEERKLNQEKI